MVKGNILSALEKKLFTAYSAVIMAITASGMVGVNLLYKIGLSELLQVG